MRLSRLAGLLHQGKVTAPPVIVGTGAFMAGHDGITGAVPFPTGYQAGDLLIVIYRGKVTIPSGWTEISSFAEYKIATSSESVIYAVGTSSSYGVAQIIAIRGVNQAYPFNVISEVSNCDEDFQAPGVTTTVDNCMMLVGVSFNDRGAATDTKNYSSFTNSSWESITQRMGTYAGKYAFTGAGVACFTGVKVVAGATGMTSATADSTANSGYCFTLAIAPE